MPSVSTELSVAVEKNRQNVGKGVQTGCPNLVVKYWVSKKFLLLSVCTDVSLCEMKAGLVE